MLNTSLSVLTAFMLSALILTITISLSKKSTIDQEKLSPFECGFNPAISPRISFSIRFFLIAMIFLIFDVEIVLLLPLPFLFSPPATLMSSTLFLSILSAGLYHEWIKGALNWST